MNTKKIMGLIAALVVLCGTLFAGVTLAGVQESVGEFTPNTYTIPGVGNCNLYMDGNLQEWPAQAKVTTISPASLLAGDGFIWNDQDEEGNELTIEEMTADLYMMWDFDALYIGMAVTKDTHMNSMRTAVDLWQEDCVMMQLSAYRNSGRNEFGFALSTWGGNSPLVWAWSEDIANRDIDSGDVAEIRLKLRVARGGGYFATHTNKTTTYEMRIPLSAITQTKSRLAQGENLYGALGFHVQNGFYEWGDGILGASFERDIRLANTLMLGAALEGFDGTTTTTINNTTYTTSTWTTTGPKTTTTTTTRVLSDDDIVLSNVGETLNNFHCEGTIYIDAPGVTLNQGWANRIIIGADVGSGEVYINQCATSEVMNTPGLPADTLLPSLLICGGNVYIANSQIADVVLTEEMGNPVQLVLEEGTNLDALLLLSFARVELKAGTSIEILSILASAQGSPIFGQGIVKTLGQYDPYDNGELVQVEVQAVDASWLRGDVNHSNEIDSTDARLILQSEVGLLTLGGAQSVIARVAGDTKADSTDARLILQYEVRLITHFPAEEGI